MKFFRSAHVTRLVCIASFWLLPYVLAQAAAQSDGPYIFRQQDGSGIAKFVHDDDAVTVTEGRVSVGSTVTIHSVGAMPAFTVHLREPEPVARDIVKLPAKTPLFVVADSHGEYEILGELLRKNRIVDPALHWSFGKGHLVILGDVFDRGPNQIEILWLIYELQAQAQRAGGGVHLLIGNHEAMTMNGDLRYLNPKYVRTAQALGAMSYAALVGSETVLGQWLRSRPAVLKIRNVLCLHGGISPQLIDRGQTLQQVNAAVRDGLSGSRTDTAAFAMGPLGPLWYRGYFPDTKDVAPATSADIERILRHFEVDAIFVGHTRVPTVTPLYDGKVIAVQVYPHRDADSGRPVMEAVKVEASTFFRATIDGRLEPLSHDATP